MARTCHLFPHLLHESNYKERQHYVKHKDDETGTIIKKYKTDTPLEFLLQREQDEWGIAERLLDHGATITKRCDLIINQGKHPQIKRVFQEHRDELAQAESLPVPIPAPPPRRQLPGPPPLRRSGARTQLQPSPSYRPPPEYHSLGFNHDEGSR